MTCTVVNLPGGGRAIVCGRKSSLVPRCACQRQARLLCDWKLGKGKTCDVAICTTCALEVAPEKHLCPEHRKAYAEWQAERAQA